MRNIISQDEANHLKVLLNEFKYKNYMSRTTLADYLDISEKTLVKIFKAQPISLNLYFSIMKKIAYTPEKIEKIKEA